MSKPQLILLYDGNCPICAWEKRNRAKKDKKERLGFINIHAPDFDPRQYGTTMDQLMARLHAITPEGQLIKGFDTLIASYRAVGWWWAYLPLSLLPKRLGNAGYGWFADHRYAISRRIGHWFGPVCDQGSCRKE